MLILILFGFLRPDLPPSAISTNELWGSKILLQRSVLYKLTAYLSDFDLFLESMKWQYYQKTHKPDNLESRNSLKLYQYSSSSFKLCRMWIFPWIKLFWHSCSIWDKLAWHNWFWQILCEGLSSFNPKGFCYSHALFWSLCERRTFFCTELVSTKLCVLLLMFSIGFTSLSVSILLPVTLIFFVFMHGFWYYLI